MAGAHCGGALIASASAVGSGVAAAQDQLKVAAVFETPIEEPWVNQIHVALLAPSRISASNTPGRKACPRAISPGSCASTPSRTGLIMGDAFGTERITRRVARDYPEVAFAFGSGIGPAGAQLRRVRPTGSTSRPISRA